MFKILSKEEAAQLVQPGACLGLNCFMTMGHADVMYQAIRDRFAKQGKQADLTLFCASGFGNWNESDYAECLAAAGMVKRVIASHFASMPLTQRLIGENRIEGYALPLGALTHWLRAYAAGFRGVLSKVGLGIYADPRQEGLGMNDISQEKFVFLTELDGEEYLYYTLPPLDVALIKGTAADPNGNITFEDECVSVDAFAMAQAVRRNKGQVIVQVDRVTHSFSRPRNVVVPGALVDAVVVEERESLSPFRRTLSGDFHVPPSHMNYWAKRFSLPGAGKDDGADQIIGCRAARELTKGDIVNIGIGIPTAVCRAATESNLLRDVHLTVESGGLGGLPAAGRDFGASIGPDMITDMASQFDFYDGGGLDICFMGALEVDRWGNVNVHKRGNTFVGIGGFGNITASTQKVVFCLTFTTKGLRVAEQEGRVAIQQEGSIPKFCQQIASYSFSAQRALKNRQQVLYVTERCVFTLTQQGLALIEVYPGIDRQRDILDKLDFAPALSLQAEAAEN